MEVARYNLAECSVYFPLTKLLFAGFRAVLLTKERLGLQRIQTMAAFKGEDLPEQKQIYNRLLEMLVVRRTLPKRLSFRNPNMDIEFNKRS